MKKQAFFISITLLMLLVLNCNTNKKKTVLTNQTNNSEMIPLNNDDHEAEWKIIDSLDQNGLPKSALEKVQELYAKVQKNNETAQIIKCLIYLGKYQTQLEEDGFVKTINDMAIHIEKAAFPQNKILESMMAEMYQRYMDQNYWKFQDRTELADFKSDDIQTWTIGQLTEKSRMLYLASINDDRTKQLELDDYKAILQNGNNAEGLQPTLYDFLVYRAIDHFSNERTYLTQPAYQFYINQPEALGDVSTFTKFNFESKDTTSEKLQMLKLFQKLLVFHQNNNSENALLYANLRRLEFVYNNAVIPDKGNIYLNTLTKLEQDFLDQPSGTEVTYRIGEYYYNSGSDYNTGEDTVKQFYYKTAYEICEKAIAKFPDSFGASQCKNLQSNIVEKSLSFQTELVNLPDEPILMSISYRNIPKVYGRIIRVSEKDRDKIEQQDYDKKGDYLMKLDPLKGFSVDLPTVGDYRNHTTEFNLDPLPLGTYLVVLSNGKDLGDKTNTLQYLYTHVSNIGYSIRNNEDGKAEIVVTHRKLSDPMENVKLEFFTDNYNSFLRRYEEKKIGETKTDTKGFAFGVGSENQSFRIRFSKGDDILNLDTRASNVVRSYDRNERRTVQFFLDREIYRPGQMVYFKGILLKYDEKGMPEIITNEMIKIELRDVNNQVAETLDLRSNEYGTINGFVTAPNNGLTGNMSFLASWNGSNNRKYFRVEDYKRPKFEVKFDPVKGSFKLGEEVTVTGNAKAYAGSNVDGAKVVYRVVREARFPYFPWWRRGYWRPSSPPVEITNGESITDAAGNFEVKFDAIPDPSLDKSTKPEFYYTVYADVIDITGETHSANRGVSIGNVALRVSLDVPELANTDSLNSAMITTTNLNGEFEAAKGTMTIEKLITPAKSYIDRLWNLPDLHILTEAEFTGLFPHLAYKDEDQVSNWKIDKTVFEASFDTEKSKELNFNNFKFQTGKYVFTLKTKDTFGEDIEIKRFITVYDLKSKKVPSNESYFHVTEQSTYEPGETASWYFGSFDKDVKMLVEVEHDNKIIDSKWLTVNGLNKEMKAIVEAYRGNIFYRVYFTKNNRFFNNAYTISIPWSNKNLTVEYGTFRDKLYPGQEETWQIKISGPKKEKVMAEMVAGMYDASLDAFAPNNWSLNPFPYAYARFGWRTYSSGTVSGREVNYNWDRGTFGSGISRYLETLNWFGFNYYEKREVYYRGNRDEVELEEMVMSDADGVSPPPSAPQGEVMSSEKLKKMPTKNISAIAADTAGLSPEDDATESAAGEGDTPPQIRTNLKETVFFFPDLKTDKDGNVIIQFTMNEALTRWKFMGLAHTKDLKIGITTKEIVTQKDLMVLPNPPRFFREGDDIEFTAKVSNLTDKDMSGIATLQLFDAISMEPIDALLSNASNEVSFTAKAGQSDRLAWKLKIPIGQLGAVTHRVVAKSSTFSDGEESALPVLTNRMLVTETKPLPVRGNQTKDFTFKAMEKASQSNTLTHHKMTLEFTSNPAWYAVQALPYLMEYPYECTEQIFSRYYSNALASSVANSHPKVKRVFEQWKGTAAMESNLSKNQELKTALLEETPWVLQAQSEEQQKRSIGLLFDLNRMANESQKALTTIADRQLSNGGFAWFPGGRDSWYITQYIVEGMGHLNELGVKDLKADQKANDVLTNAVNYIDDRIEEHYEDLKKQIKRYGGDLEKDHLDYMAIHYLYARSFFIDIPIREGAQNAVDYYLGQSEKYWLNKGMYAEGMIALALNRFIANSATPSNIVKSLKERSLNNEEMGMYWKYESGYYWYQLPIETHALMIEVFDEVAKDEKAVDDLKVWLLKNKQTTHWKTTKATASAVYALLRRGDNWLLEDQPVKITLGDKVIDQSKLQTEAGTGYFKTSWDGDEIKNDMSQIKVENPNKVVAWGALYWQYFEQLDKIKTFEETPLTINKKLFKVQNSDTGPQMTLLTEGAKLSPGDKLHVRIELRVDRDMEYVHMKDMRASGFEPTNVLSTYKWQGGLGYYESTRDAATNFFISYLPKGTYVFEYPMRVIHNGDFSNGITTIQCMYAPEFTSHSEGIRVKVGE
jgi:uncharacterized protein YfaS (alpha-2-macroglobulin family)